LKLLKLKPEEILTQYYEMDEESWLSKYVETQIIPLFEKK